MKYLGFIFLLILVGCGAAEHTSEEVSSQTMIQVKEKVDAKEFKIHWQYAYPKQSGSFSQVVQDLGLNKNGNTSTAISISNDDYYFELKQDSVSTIIPFYGESHSGNEIASRKTGIEFSGSPKNFNYKAQTTNADTSAKLKFSINDANRASENYRVSLQIFSNGKATMTVSSSRRSSISYRGELVL